MKIRLTCQGTRPLLMCNVQVASPLNPYAKKLKALNAKRVKTDEDYLEIARIEFEGHLYWAEQVGPYVPANMLRKALVRGARIIKTGVKVERGVVFADYMLPLVYQGPREVAELWNGGDSLFADIRPVTVYGRKVDRCRPIFREWLIEAELVTDPRVIELEELRESARLAGEMAGIGDYRDLYGHFSSRVERL